MGEQFDAQQELIAEWQRSQHVMEAEDLAFATIPKRENFKGPNAEAEYIKSAAAYVKSIQKESLAANVQYLNYRLKLIQALSGLSLADPSESDDPFAVSLNGRKT